MLRPMMKKLIKNSGLRKFISRAWAPAAIAIAGAVILVNIFGSGSPGGHMAQANGSTVAVAMPPAFSMMGDLGGRVFNKTCATCHGNNASGTDKGPPLIPRIYEPSHHADGSFARAVRQGVRAHHWPYGDMPPQPEITDDQLSAIITFVREVQRANGIQ